MMKIYKNWGPPLVTQLMATSTKLLALPTGKIKTRNLALLLFCSLLALNSCKTDEAAAPAASSFTVDKTSAIIGVEFTFTITEVKANSVTLYPYGVAQAAWATVPVTFTGGSATVKFKYDHVGAFDAVVISNNNTTDPDGKVSVKNTVSPVTTITITNNKAKFTKFLVDKSISRKSPLDTTVKAVKDTVPFGTDIAKLKASFTTDPFAVVTVGGVVQDDKTTNNYASPLTFNVKSQDGAKATDYNVSVYVIPVEKNTDIKSLSGAATSTNALGGEDKKTPTTVGGSVDNGPLKKAVLYLPYGSPSNMYDSIEVSYATAGSFSVLKYGAEKPKMKQGRRLDLSTNKTLVVVPQDSAGTTPSASYTLYATTAPKIDLSFTNVTPVLNGKTDGFNITFNAITGTDLLTLKPAVIETLPGAPGVVTINSYTTQSTADNSPVLAFTPGTTPVNFTKPVKFMLNVTDTSIGVTYTVVYTVTVTVIP
jgi:hypothetical protein